MKRRHTVIASLTLALVGPALVLAQTPNFNDDAVMVLKLAERSQDLRQRMTAFAARNKDTQRITGDQHALADQAIREYGAIRIRLWDVVERVRSATGMGQGRRPIAAAWHTVTSLFQRSQGATEGEAHDERLRQTLLGAAAATVMIDNAVCAIENLAGTIFETRGDRPVTMSGDEGLAGVKLDMVIQDLFHEVVVSYNDVANRNAFKQVVEYLVDRQDRVQTLISEGMSSEEIRALNALVFESEAAADFADGSTLGADYAARVAAVKARLGKRLERDMNALSKVFGNAVGSVHLGTATITGDERERIAERLFEILEPGDLLLDKTSFAVTDRLIPGHFGHVAIWLGRPDQLEGLGLFDPAVNTYGDSLRNAQQWRSELMSGTCILEALRPGVVINTIEHFLNLDEVLVLRLKPEYVGGTDEVARMRSHIVCRGMHHLGQRYDFNFDVNTSNTIVCSELAYQAYPETIPWPLGKSVGRWTISPDQVAVMAGPDAAFPFEIVYYVRSLWDGDRITGHEELDGRPLGGGDHYRFYWTTLLQEFHVPDPPEYDNGKLQSWAEAVRTLAGTYGIAGATE